MNNRLHDAYQDASRFPSSIKYVPSLVSLCIRILSQYPDQIHHLPPGFHLKYHPNSYCSQFDILRALIPTYSSDSGSFSLERVDPNLWATLVQLFPNSIPSSFTTYLLPLSDAHLPLLQLIPATPSCAIITVLELPGCKEITDDTITKLRVLHNLVALDLSDTCLTNLGISRLASACIWSTQEYDRKPERRGPWGIRIIRLRNCYAVDNVSIQSLSKFVLLSVIDLRGSAVVHSAFGALWHAVEPPSSKLYHPTPLTESLSILESFATLYLSASMYRIHVNRCSSQKRPRFFSSSCRHDGAPSHVLHDSPVIFPPSDKPYTLPDQNNSLDELELMSKVVAVELQADSRMRKLREFYASPPSREPITLWDPPDSSYSAQRYYKCFREKLPRSIFADSTPTRKLDKLMLYRHPPSQDSLDNSGIPSIAKKEQLVDGKKAALDRGHSKMITMAEQHRQLMAKRRRVSNESRPVFGGGNLSVQRVFAESDAVTELTGRNPFRKAVGVVSSVGQRSSYLLSKSTATSEGDVLLSSPQAALPAHSSSRNHLSNDASKPLKPISFIPIPPLPPQEKRKLKEATMKEATLEKKRKLTKRCSLDNGLSSSSRGDPRRRSSNTNNTKISKSSSEGFNWKAWGGS
ncbi:hypothetical protein L218DRAFT_1076162 [Marasmius fiardii PR-910]|nr:hypothetical protein L218DRAFT_1076162 [Marasmius fiardii PR-910]